MFIVSIDLNEINLELERGRKHDLISVDIWNEIEKGRSRVQKMSWSRNIDTADPWMDCEGSRSEFKFWLCAKSDNLTTFTIQRAIWEPISYLKWFKTSSIPIL